MEATTQHHQEIPGEPTETATALLETATAAIQGFGPVNKIHQHLCAYIYINLPYLTSNESLLIHCSNELNTGHMHAGFIFIQMT